MWRQLNSPYMEGLLLSLMHTDVFLKTKGWFAMLMTQIYPDYILFITKDFFFSNIGWSCTLRSILVRSSLVVKLNNSLICECSQNFFITKWPFFLDCLEIYDQKKQDISWDTILKPWWELQKFYLTSTVACINVQSQVVPHAYIYN